MSKHDAVKTDRNTEVISYGWRLQGDTEIVQAPYGFPETSAHYAAPVTPVESSTQQIPHRGAERHGVEYAGPELKEHDPDQDYQLTTPHIATPYKPPPPVDVRIVDDPDKPSLMEPARPIAFSSVDQQVFTGSARIMGFNVGETVRSNPISLTFYDGLNATGVPVAFYSLAAGESARDWFSPAGIDIRIGLYVDYDTTLTGTGAGIVYVVK